MRGESFIGNILSDCGIRSGLRAGGDLSGFTSRGDGGGRETDGDFKGGVEEKAGLVAVEGWEIGDGPLLSNENFGKDPAEPFGLSKTGVRALKNSVYASGVGMEPSLPLLLLSSRLISMLRALGSSWISEGKVNDFGVFNGGRSGFWVGIAM